MAFSLDMKKIIACLPTFGIILLLAAVVYKLLLGPGKLLGKPTSKAIETTNKAIKGINNAVSALTPLSGILPTLPNDGGKLPGEPFTSVDECEIDPNLPHCGAFHESFGEESDVPSACPTLDPKMKIFTGKPLIDDSGSSDPEAGCYTGMDSVTGPCAPKHNMDVASFYVANNTQTAVDLTTNDPWRSTIVTSPPATQNWSIRPDIENPFRGYLKQEDYSKGKWKNFRSDKW